ncbi:MAG: radical SAM protein [Christensenellaceae bacterium]|jgi:anaerobic ribonucleoside-triphosphate reductase activating protein|nr:radical SAM protein [Christensenellaceae bacterium]
MISIAGFQKNSAADGPGLRYTLFLQGCPRRCANCHNPQTQPFEGGTAYTAEALFDDFLTHAYSGNFALYSGVTLSGGEPFCQSEALIPFAKLVKSKGFEVAAYTGYQFEDLVAEKGALLKGARELLNYCDVIVDGEWVESLFDLDLKFKGSANQRTIDVKKSIEKGETVLSVDERWV